MLPKKYLPHFFFIFSAVLTYLLMGQLIQSRLTADSLVKVSGTINTTIEVTMHYRSSNEPELRVYLYNHPDYFTLMNIYKYKRFSNKIHPGDKADIYIRPHWLVPLAMGHANDIFQMAINGETIFYVAETKSNTNGIIILFLFLIPLFIFIGLYQREKNKKSSQQAA